MIKVSAFKWVPPFAQGYVRDIRVRWALEEAGLPYEEKLVGFEDVKSADHRKSQPFGQVPTLEEDGKTLFESGAIVLHIAQRSPNLTPADPFSKDRMMMWVMCALNTVEPQVQNLNEIDLFHAKEDWAKARRPQVLDAMQQRLADLSAHFGKRDYLEERFTAADLITTSTFANSSRCTESSRRSAPSKSRRARPQS